MDRTVSLSQPTRSKRVVEPGRPRRPNPVGGYGIEERLGPAKRCIDADLGYPRPVVAADAVPGGRQPLGVKLGSVLGATPTYFRKPPEGNAFTDDRGSTGPAWRQSGRVDGSRKSER